MFFIIHVGKSCIAMVKNIYIYLGRKSTRHCIDFIKKKINFIPVLSGKPNLFQPIVIIFRLVLYIRAY